MWTCAVVVRLLLSIPSCLALPYLEDYVDYNLNQNETATTSNPLDYWGEWSDHTYQESPENWRMPIYTITLDRFINGDPSNDEANQTHWEHDVTSNQFRFGGDIKGLQSSLDYIQGIGVKALYLAGSPFINVAWGSDGYSPLDHTLLDAHHGRIADWREAITEIHRRGMYVILDNTMATMGDLIGFEGYLNDSTGTPFSFEEHEFLWKSDRRYFDFQPSNEYNTTCDYPAFWYDDGDAVGTNVTSQMVGCKNSEFDQYGEVSAFGTYDDWQRQLSKFAFVQDRLREWNPSVRAKLERFSCITIAMLDIDGYRMDKALQVTIDAQAAWSASIRECAKSLGKNNFFITGEVVDGNTFGAIYFGRGKLADAEILNLTEAVLATNETTSDYVYMREFGEAALDSAAFHYSIYRALTVFLGMDGKIGAVGDTSFNFVESWHQMVAASDFVNSFTGVYDPRHMFGVTNQDVFRYPGLKNGTQKELLGLFITTLHMPGIPLTVWGEEQAFYVLDNQASNYVFGRAPMASNQAWQMHGCYKLDEIWYTDMPFESALTACNDDSISLDHRDPSHPVRNILKRMYQLREEFPVLNDGFVLEALSNKTYEVLFPGSGNRTTEFGVWSVLRSRTEGVQDFTGNGQGNQSVWFIYTNQNETVDHSFDCSSDQLALVSPFAANTTVRNLFYPYEEYTLDESPQILGFEGSNTTNGCISELSLRAWEYKALVPTANFVQPLPVITKVLPGHDSRTVSTVPFGSSETVAIEIHFSQNMSCDGVASSLYFNSTTTDDSGTASLDTYSCISVVADELPLYIGAVPTAWIFKANLTNVYNGVHTFTVNNATSAANLSTNTIDHFMFRIGNESNPMVFPNNNMTTEILHKDVTTGDLYIVPNAAGADKFRYSLNWGSSYSNWTSYTGSNYTLAAQEWSGTEAQKWEGEHVILQYWSSMTGSADHVQHAELSTEKLNIPARRFPHIFTQGSWNQFGYDSGLPNSMKLVSDNLWSFNFMAEWPNTIAFNVWGINPDKLPDQTLVFGDVDGDGILDRVPPVTLLKNNVSLSSAPAMPYLSYKLTVNDKTLGYSISPAGSAWHQLVLYIFMAIIPPITGVIAVLLFKKSFYGVKHNYIGVEEKKGIFDALKTPSFDKFSAGVVAFIKEKRRRDPAVEVSPDDILSADAGAANRRKVLIATMEYEIEDWSVKIKIGGLGVMASLMGKNLGHQDLVWVVPCVGGIDYPLDQVVEPMIVTVLGNNYDVQVQYHVVRNITYVLLDAPVFRAQSKSEPYPPRMDDVDSAVYYSVWNSCIAEAMRRFKPDIYHINDYHGAVAPLHLLPQTIPCCLSLHNAEFQGLWPMRTQKEINEVCAIYNLTPEVAKKYVQFGEVFNLLHAGASYLRVHQKGFGAVGVSKKYGVRSFARYSIFWGLSKIGALPNPDPSDQADWDKNEKQADTVVVDAQAEAARGPLRIQAQQWAGLKQDPNAELFVFVGRWSMQKGVDLIADVFPSVLEQNPNVQLICVGPVIDLYGRFAAMKLDKMMTKYPGRVCSKPVFTALPPFIFSGAEFALIPSRDEPFGLVAVEFGRKGALGVGARVGGLGQMPGWWFTIESTTTKHLMRQFKMAIQDAMASSTEVRAMMRARSALQRFPVAQWVEDLGILQSKAIKQHQKYSSPRLGLHDNPSSTGLAVSAPNGGLASASSSIYSVQSTAERIMSSSWLGPGRRRPPPSPLSTEPNSRAPSRSNSRNILESNSRSTSQVTISGPSSSRLGNKIRKPGRILFSTGPDDESESELDSPHGHSRENSYPLSQVSPQPHSRAVSNTSAEPSLQQLQDYERTHDEILDSYSMDPFGDDVPRPFGRSRANSMLSLASVDAVVGERKDFKLQAIDPFFTDSTGDYGAHFEGMLNSLDGKTSEGQLCIEDFLKKSEKQWYSRLNDAKLGIASPMSSTASVFKLPWGNKSTSSLGMAAGNNSRMDVSGNADMHQFGLRDDHQAPTGVRRLMQLKIGDWPVYAFILAFGQIIAANSYQITLLIGQNGEEASELYTVASIYLVASAMWWVLFRNVQAVYVLSTPFIFYGFAFFFVGMVPYIRSSDGKAWMQNVATALYAIASSSGSLFFALNFGSEGGAAVESWAFRACVIQGSQQIYVSLLWYWGATLTKQISNGVSTSSLISNKPAVTGITTPIAFFLWGVGALIFLGLPSFYRQKPGTVPSFYMSVCRRKIIGWFLVMVIIQNYWMSAPYGRNWSYLWSSNNVSAGLILLLVIIFFIGVWAGFLWLFAHLSKADSWIIPLFAIGLGAPRWCQMLWGISNIGLYVPWAGGPVGSALMGRALWLWLGVLDAIQGVGFGMILLQTLTRLHVVFSLIAAQIIGSLATIAARASAPNKVGPGTVFPDFSGGFSEGLKEPVFWVGLLFQGVICVGFFVFFRKEQLFKP